MERRRLLLLQRRLDKSHRILARPFSRTGQRRHFAALAVDQQRGRHAEGSAALLQILENLGGRIGVIGEGIDADLLQPGFRLVRIAGVDIHRDHFETGPAQLLLEGYAPGLDCRQEFPLPLVVEFTADEPATEEVDPEVMNYVHQRNVDRLLHEALRLGAAKLSVKTRFIQRIAE